LKIIAYRKPDLSQFKKTQQFQSIVKISLLEFFRHIILRIWIYIQVVFPLWPT